MTEDEVQGLVGLDVAEAQRRVEAAGWRFRVLSRDGESFPGTADLREDRVNVHVAVGKVEAADVG